MERRALLLVAWLCSIPSFQTTARLVGAESARRSPYIAAPARIPHAKTSVGGETTPQDDPGEILAAVSESWVRFWGQELPRQPATNKAATREGDKDGAVDLPCGQCTRDFRQLFQTYTGGPHNHSLGHQAIDAFGKPGSGVLEGNMYAYGSFDECFAIGEDKVQYLVAPVTVVQILGNVSLFTFEMGMCVPRSCNGSDVECIVNAINRFIVPPKNNTYQLLCAGHLMVTKSKRLPYSGGAVAMIVVCALFATLVFAATLMEILVWEKTSWELSVSANPDEEWSSLLEHKRHTQRRKALDFILAFSLFKNVSMISTTKQPPESITPLNGIRVLSMFWMILCHTQHWVCKVEMIKNPNVVATVVTRFSYQAIVNGSISVDSFFLLSGTLAAYLTLREMEKRRLWFFIVYYIHRYLRLTMVYAFVLFFYWFLTVYLGDGNTWIAYAGPESPLQKNCRKYWWTNLLYINNLYPWKLNDECFKWSWYLANDMQFFVIAPLIIIPLFFFFPIGLAVSGIFLAASFIATGAIAGVKDFSANMYQQMPNGTEEAQELNYIYGKPYCRIPPYLVGLVLGYLLYKKVQFPSHWRVNWIIYGCLWITAAGCCISTLYGLYDSWHGHELSHAENVTYFMFSRFTWAVGLALMVFACHNGYGWVINDFLSMKLWTPLSRLTYSAYLVHGIILTVIFGTLRDPITYTDYILAVFAIANVVLSYGFAGVVATFVEFPLSNLEVVVFKVIGLQLRESTRRVEVHKWEKTTEEYTASTVR